MSSRPGTETREPSHTEDLPIESIEAQLEQIPFLQSLPPDHLAALARAGDVIDVPAGSAVFEEGDPADHLYLILEGSASVQGHNTLGREIPLSFLSSGQFFGELALAEHGTRSATVRADADLRLFRLGRDAFVTLLGEAPEMLSQVMGAISQKIRNANTHYYQEQLQQQTLRLKLERENYQSVARLITGMADELQPSLQQMRAQLSELERSLSDADQTGLCQNLMTQLRQLQQRIETFRAISAEQIEGSPEPVHWQALLDEFLEIYNMSSDRALPIALVLTPEAAHATWYGYPGILHTVLLHLLNNAEQHAYPDERGEVEIMVTVRGQASERWFEVIVTDEGVGMDADMALHAKEPFVSSRRGEGASGLGLAVVDSLVSHSLGGSMELRSGADHGTKVILRIPVKAPSASV